MISRHSLFESAFWQYRRRLLVALLVVLVCALGLQAVTADTTESVSQTGEGTYPGATLISVRDYGYDGRLIEVSQNGSVNWEYDPARSRVFEAEYLENGNVLVAVATKRSPDDRPEEQLDHDPDECVHNRVSGLDGGALADNETEVVRRYT